MPGRRLKRWETNKGRTNAAFILCFSVSDSLPGTTIAFLRLPHSGSKNRTCVWGLIARRADRYTIPRKSPRRKGVNSVGRPCKVARSKHAINTRIIPLCQLFRLKMSKNRLKNVYVLDKKALSNVAVLIRVINMDVPKAATGHASPYTLIIPLCQHRRTILLHRFLPRMCRARSATRWHTAQDRRSLRAPPVRACRTM